MNNAALVGLRLTAETMHADWQPRTAREMEDHRDYRGTDSGDTLIGTGPNTGERWTWSDAGGRWIRYR